MRNKNLLLTLLLLAFSIFVLIGATLDGPQNQKLTKTTTNDVYDYIAINQCLMYQSNNGDGSHNNITDGSGFYWPGGVNATITAIFEDGLIWGGKIGREIRVGGSTYRSGLQAGKILADGTADDPSDSKYRIYKIRKDWISLPLDVRADYQTDYEQWPWEDGAPFVDKDGDGIYTPYVDEPDFIGDEVLWFVANDLDPARTTYLYGTAPLGLEMQCTIFAFNRSGDLGDMVFKKYKVINKGINTIKNMYLAYWSDTDLGEAGDDFTGCDVDLSLGYTYNADSDDDGQYGQDPPAVGYVFFQGPIIESVGDSAKFGGGWRHDYKNLGMTSFSLYINGDDVFQDPDLGVPEGSSQMYYYMTSRYYSGEHFTDPDGNEVDYVVPGDPYLGTGWYEGEGWPGGKVPGDRRHVMSSGPFTMAPGDTQEVTVGIVIARAPGEGNLAAVRELKRKTVLAQKAYDLDFQLTPSPPPPTSTAVIGDRKVRLYWETNAEDYDAGDPMLANKGFDDTTFTFEGYRVWQFSNQAGENPILLNTNDLENDVDVIYGKQTINGVEIDVPLINSPNAGLVHQFVITSNAYTNSPLINGTTYYFGITSYGYSPNSAPRYLESSPAILVVRPATHKIDESFPYESGEFIQPTQLSGFGDGGGYMFVVDPAELTGNKYLMTLNGPENDLTYDVFEIDGDDTTTVITAGSHFGMEYSGQPIIDGFQFVVLNQGEDELDGLSAGIRSIMEIKGPAGTELDEPISVDNNYNSTSEWKMVGLANPDIGQELNWAGKIGYDNYEIRFTSGGSEYYLSGYHTGFASSAPYKDDPKAANKLPFEVWCIGKDVNTTDDDVRLVLKVLDNNNQDPTAADSNGVYSELENGNWEQVYAYFADSIYQDTLPDMSGRSAPTKHRLGKIIFRGSNLPAEGTVIRITTWRPLSAEDSFELIATPPKQNDFDNAKSKLDEISVFPNPYFAANANETSKYNRFVRFTNLPKDVTIKIYSLAGVFVRKLEKSDDSQWMDWDLMSKTNLPVGSGIYIAHLEMPSIGTKIMKLAIIQGKQYIDRL